MDVIEIDAASESGVDDVREKIIQFAEYAPAMSRYKIFIIDEVHDLSAKAFDALLKTIEEPPAHLVFILASTEFTKLPPTIRSRCQKYEFHRGSIGNIVSRLRTVCEREGIAADEAALDALARMADGGYRDALTLLEHASITSEGSVTVAHIYDVLGLITEDQIDAMLNAISQRNAKLMVDSLYELLRQGRPPQTIVEALLNRLAELTRAFFGIDEGDDGAARASTREASVRLGKAELARLRNEISNLHRYVKQVSLPRLWLEAELLRLCDDPVPVVAEASRERAATHSAESKVAPAKANGSSPKQEVKAAAAVVVPERQKADLEPETSANQPELPNDPINQKWRQAVIQLQKQWESAGRKLSNTHAIEVAEGQWQVVFTRESDYDTVVQGKHASVAQKRIRDVVETVLGRPIQIEFLVNKGKPVVVESSAVELPVRNKELHRIAEQVFGSGDEAPQG